MSNLLEIQGLSKAYGSVQALDDVSLSIAPGHIVGLLGPNGSGKTTLIKIICGLLRQDKGTVLVDGNPVDAKSKAIVSYLPDRTYLDEDMTTQYYIEMFKCFYDDFDEKRAMTMLADLGINPKDKLRTLSKGNMEKVQLILVMSRRAKLYILDEPIAGVDPAAREYIMRTIIGNFEPTASMIIATHLIADIEPVLDEAVFLQNGSIKLFRSVDDIRSENGKSVEELFKEVYRC